MYDSLLMREVNCVRDLIQTSCRLLGRHGTALQAFSQAWSINQRHREIMLPVDLSDRRLERCPSAQALRPLQPPSRNAALHSLMQADRQESSSKQRFGSAISDAPCRRRHSSACKFFNEFELTKNGPSRQRVSCLKLGSSLRRRNRCGIRNV